MKKIIVLSIISVISLATPVSAHLFQFENGTGYYIENLNHIYAETGIVTDLEIISETETLLTITVANGNIFQCTTEDTDWFVNDLASILMDSKGTEIVYDDEVIDIKYAGVLEHFLEYVTEEDELC